MALYISAGRRRRRFVLATAVALAVGLGVGWSVGRASAPSITETVATARTRGERLATRLEALTIEYEQVLKGADTVEGGVLQPLAEIDAGAEQAGRDAPWVDAFDRQRVAAALDAVRAAATARAPAEVFATSTADGSKVLQDVFSVGR